MKNQLDFEFLVEQEEPIHFFGNELTIKNSLTVNEVKCTRQKKTKPSLPIGEREEELETASLTLKNTASKLIKNLDISEHSQLENSGETIQKAESAGKTLPSPIQSSEQTLIHPINFVY